jgi:hypothetical protein
MRRMCGLRVTSLTVSLGSLYIPVCTLISLAPLTETVEIVELILGSMLEKQAAAVAKNLDLVLKGKEPLAYKSDGDRTFNPVHIFRVFFLTWNSNACSGPRS